MKVGSAAQSIVQANDRWQHGGVSLLSERRRFPFSNNRPVDLPRDGSECTAARTGAVLVVSGLPSISPRPARSTFAVRHSLAR